MRKKTTIETIGGVTNGGKSTIESALPFSVELEICGSCDFLFHRWNNDSVAAKAAAAKGSAAKKSDDVESYVFRRENGNLAIPGEYLRASIVNAAKFRQDPRSPRKSAVDIFKAGVASLTTLADLGLATWDYLDRRRALVQRNAITRTRPALKTGWRAKFALMEVLPEYISEVSLRDVVNLAGRAVGLGDNRPSFGRFDIVLWNRLTEELEARRR